MNALERLELEANSDPYDDEFDWHTAYSSPLFDTLEHPKPLYIYDELTEPDSDRITKTDYPELANRWEPGHVGGRHG